MLKQSFFSNYLNKNYLLYGGSILISRGAEYLVLLIAAGLITKDSYGQLEFYKKIIEVLSILVAFGFPPLILSYTRSQHSKKYFFVLALGFISIFSALFALILIPFELSFLAIPLLFYAVFFTNGIFPVFHLVHDGSQKASLYKMLVSVIFYGVILGLYYFGYYEYSFVIVNYILLPVGFIYTILVIRKLHISQRKLVKYWKLLKRLLLSSFTLVLSNFANIMFMYSDIFVITLLSTQVNKEIADYSFPLNIANALLIIPFTLVQVDIEKIKNSEAASRLTMQKIIKLTLLGAVCIVAIYLLLINTAYAKYDNTLNIFYLIIIAKIFQSLAVLLGTKIMIYKLFRINLMITSSIMVTNFVISYLIYPHYGLIGIAAASIFSLFLRYLLLVIANRKHKNKS
ncbi:oligosaccharide flippase family protein [Psychroserpens sp.]|uniref:oligosaccharide flippase family protein n=1 Tax=Psychroserpens sp. TaxID=2020870 RepID=UPI001B258517|nr:oligosaccharide flippase family protein [Psychroserpens sp.]MBO6605392.1 oligosaccharide flippase family protein [Psychroserpens sp.]MBO6630168.1 oligosaccharide flippase family protein [Psychroserpens sp.]MBO6653799.1 oligosaccharide flippase family protein [Psychroserpens sp.]MBO6682120.1 oligosaccharide flippase family protein [Psychroserpens sp.]MBO6748766.1 oligosaccharide flippase family protein [Psychroserpens sp.]